MYGSVFDYCLEDVCLLRRLVEGAKANYGVINNPKGPEYPILRLDISPIAEKGECL